MMTAETELPDHRQAAVLSVQQLRLSVGQGNRQSELIHDIDLELFAGEVVGLVGESGSGKSLTANALLGLLPSHQAQLHAQRFVLNGEQILADSREEQWRGLRGRHLAMIFQDPQSSLDPVFTIGQQMQRVIRRHLNVDRSQSRRIAASGLAECGLGDTERILHCYPHQLSGGMRQRVMIAMALNCSPQILIADEVTSALDISSRDQVLVLLRQIADRHGTAILLISHDLSAVARICDRLMVMYAGRIVESGPTTELLGQAAHPYTAGLLAATPRVSQGKPLPVQAIAGSLHALQETLPACAFAPRCPAASAICSQQQPLLHDLGPTRHRLACHHPVHP